MPDLSYRSTQPELLDQTGIPFPDIEQNMRELDFINRYLGGHAISIGGLQQLIQTQNRIYSEPLLIAEIGCGDGNNLMALQRWCVKKNIPVRFIGIDLNPECIAAARLRKGLSDAEWICSDYAAVQFTEKPDILFSSLFCHHFTDEALAQQLAWLQRNCRIGFFINDLHRHPLAYYSIQWLTRLFSKSYLVKNDAPLSVWRGFKRKEWRHLLERAGIRNFTIQWKWAFRWLICFKQPVTEREN
jgi:ubiquinone/menaquinone biosynthesis C-methylase UbiE